MVLEQQHDTIEQTLNSLLEIKNLNQDDLLIKLVSSSWKKQVLTKLSQILRTPLTLEELELLIQPWVRANKLMWYWKEISWEWEKKQVKECIKAIAILERRLMKKREIDTLVSLIAFSEHTNSELLLNLAKEKDYLNLILSISPGNGKAFSADHFIKYSIHSLFYMAEQMGLEKSKQPYEINKYLDAITERTYSDRNKDAHYYRENNLLEQFYVNRNVIHRFIYNPYCKDTSNKLRKIRLRRLPTIKS